LQAWCEVWVAGLVRVRSFCVDVTVLSEPLCLDEKRRDEAARVTNLLLQVSDYVTAAAQ
jgi:hypothetical protein